MSTPSQMPVSFGRELRVCLSFVCVRSMDLQFIIHLSIQFGLSPYIDPMEEIRAEFHTDQQKVQYWKHYEVQEDKK